MQHADILALAGLRIDGRRPSELRNIRFKVGSQNSSDGSCYIEHGLNKILVSIHGPQETKKRIAEQQLFNEQGILVCEVFNAPFSGTERKKRNGSDKRSIEIENMIKQTFEPIILLELYQHSEISISVCIFEIDGSIESSILNACTMALMDAGIAMNDMVIACSAGVIKQQLCQDLNAV
jgi:exosome complex component RRP41